MLYMQLTGDKWVEVNEERNTSRIIVKSELEGEADFLKPKD